MYRIEKIALIFGGGLVFTALFAAVFTPVISSGRDRQRNAERGSEFIRTVFLKVQPNQGKATLVAPPRRERSYKISLDDKREYDWNQLVTLDSTKKPVVVPVKVGTYFSFDFRHGHYRYKVTAINPNGVEVEIGRDSLLSRSYQVLLPKK